MKKSKEKSNRFDYLNIKTIEGKKRRRVGRKEKERGKKKITDWGNIYSTEDKGLITLLDMCYFIDNRTQ